MTKFQEIAAFVQVVDRGGFSAAGKQLGISVSAVTKSVSRLEDDLNIKLFNRTTRRIALTEYGQEFYDRCVRILADLDEAETMMRDSSTAPKGRVRMILPPGFGRVAVMPELPRFYERFPDISLDIRFSDAGLEILQEGYDLAVVIGDLADSRLVRRVLLREPMTVVASTEYLRKHGVPKEPEDLVNHDCIISRVGFEWPFKRSDEKFVVRVNGRLVLLNGGGYREAALYGLGVAYSRRSTFRQFLDRGVLRSLLQEFCVDDIPISVVYHDKRHIPRKTQAVIDFLQDITREYDTEAGSARPCPYCS